MTFPPYGNQSPRRLGLSLLEAVVALAIMLFSVAALSQLISIGSDRALDVQQQSHATWLCQRKLAEVMVGAEPLNPSGYASFPEQGMEDWQWKLDASQNSVTGLWNVQVSVKYEGQDNRTTEVHLGQMILDPSIRGSSQDPPPLANATSGSSDSADASTGGGTSSGGSTPSSGSSTPSTPSARPSATPAAAPAAKSGKGS